MVETPGLGSCVVFRCCPNFNQTQPTLCEVRLSIHNMASNVIDPFIDTRISHRLASVNGKTYSKPRTPAPNYLGYVVYHNSTEYLYGAPPKFRATIFLVRLAPTQLSSWIKTLICGDPRLAGFVHRLAASDLSVATDGPEGCMSRPNWFWWICTHHS